MKIITDPIIMVGIICGAVLVMLFLIACAELIMNLIQKIREERNK